MKLYMVIHGLDSQDFAWLSVGVYPQLVGNVKKKDFVRWLFAWPQQAFVVVRLLEWWSSFDVDTYLAGEGIAVAWRYSGLMLDQWFIKELRDEFAVLKILPPGKWLEWVLYPETYNVGEWGDVVKNLIRMQVREFEKIFGEQTKEKIADLDINQKVKVLWQSLTWYDVLILASVVEKEERVDSQRKDAAGVFLNRIDGWMRLDADITLCYGLGKWFEGCSPNVIVQHLYDNSNPYNTRAVWWLPPTPIVSPSASSIEAILHARDHDYLYYLHDGQGRLYLSKTIQEHTVKKEQYIR